MVLIINGIASATTIFIAGVAIEVALRTAYATGQNALRKAFFVNSYRCLQFFETLIIVAVLVCAIVALAQDALVLGIVCLTIDAAIATFDI